MDIQVLVSPEMGENTLVVPLANDTFFVVDPACEIESEKKIAAVVLTHGHFDHVSALKNLCRKNPRVPVLIHELDAKYIGKNALAAQSKILGDCGILGISEMFSDMPSPTGFLRDGERLSDAIETADEKIKAALSEWTVLHTPGHSAGSICLLNEKERVLISGDTMFYHSYGRTDFFDGSMSDMTKSLRRLYALSGDILVYPGHDAVSFPLSENQF